jgi:hypothetical protein
MFVMPSKTSHHKHHVNRSNMRDTFNQSTKLTITKVGSSIGSRSSAFSAANLLRLPPNILRQSLPTGLLNNPTPRRRIACFKFYTPEESNENIETSVGNLFGLSQSRQLVARLPLRSRSLSKEIMVTPLSPISSSVDALNENVTPEMVDGRSKKIHLSIRPKVLDATSVRALGLNLSSSLNAELPFLPEVGRMNADVCFTPAPSKRVSGVFSPPVLQ